MAKRTATPRTVSIDTMSKSLQRTLRAEGKSEKTVYSYALSVRLLSEFLDERGRELTINVSKDDLRDFITEQATRRKLPNGKMGGSPATAMVRFKSLQQFFRHCVEEEELDVSPMAGMRAPKVEHDPVPIVPDDVLARLVKARAGKTLEDRRDTAIFRVFLDTGCRLSEVTNLRVSDVNLDNQTIQVLGKGNRVRHVTFGMKAAQAIERYLRLLERERPEMIAEPDSWLWVGRQGRMTTSGITDILHRMCDDAGVPRLHWHQLRHTFAHEWLAKGGNEGDLMSLAGWQSRSMLDRYAKSAQVERAHAASRRMSLGDRI
ncbi:MAG: tyrosine-type recombinase/integrase [Acidimicrobiales bacterium]